MAPATDNSETSSTWQYFVFGCGGCAVLAVLAIFAVRVAMGYFVGWMVSSALSTPPPPRVGPYKYGYASSAAKCSVVPPGYSGSITYLHVLTGGGGVPYGEGQRAIRMATGASTSVDLPLQQYSPTAVRVGVYWYPARKRAGPYIRLYDACGESLIDLGKKKSIAVLRVGKTVYGGDFVDSNNYGGFTYDILSGSFNKPLKVGSVTFDGKPAYDITPIIGKNKGKYLGSIVRTGNALIFAPAP